MVVVFCSVGLNKNSNLATGFLIKIADFLSNQLMLVEVSAILSLICLG